MFRYLPSKKVFFVAVFAVGLLGFVLISQTIEEGQFRLSQKSLLSTVATADFEYQDTDKDGLPDWEEGLFDTNMNSNDSNNDGILDGEELVSKKIYKELDVVSLSEQLGLDTGADPSEISGDNVTQTLLTNASIDFASLDPNSITPQLENEIINDLSQNIDRPQRVNPYNGSDLNVISSKETVVDNYVLQFLLTITQHPEIYDIDPLLLINNWNEKSADELAELQTSYVLLSEKLIQIPVPDSLAKIQLELANNFYNSSAILEDVKSLELDPIRSMLAAAEYTQYRTERTSLIVHLTQAVNTILQ